MILICLLWSIRHILRISGKDIDGSKKIIVALSIVRGIGYNIAQVMLQSLNINPYIRVGFVTESELKEIELTIKDPSRVGIPAWYFNRRKDMDTGSDKHLVTSDLDFTISNDIEREKSVMSWRGYRHMFGLKVRGQHTRTVREKSRCCWSKEVNQARCSCSGCSWPGQHQLQLVRQLLNRQLKRPLVKPSRKC